VNISHGKENYSWNVDKEDNPLDEPVKADDDACDMEPYAMMAMFNTKRPVFRVRTPPDD
jgi:hypothetical protein